MSRLARAVALLSTVALAGPASALEHGDLIARGVRQVLSGDPDAAAGTWVRLRAIDPSHPAPAVFAAYGLFARQSPDMNDPTYDAEIRRWAGEGIRLAEARVVADPRDAEAHFYLGQALFQRARIQGIRGELLAAGSDGERAREHLEAALSLEPALVDAKLPLGMYYYYAGLLPRMIRWLSWLWFVPSGDAPTGLRYLEEVQRGGDLYRWDATFLLMNIYTHHQPDYPRALRLGGELVDRFPENAFFGFEWAELLLEAGRYEESLEQVLRLERGAVGAGRDANVRRMAPLLRARAELLRGYPRRAQSVIEIFGPDGPKRPYWGSAWVFLTRGQILDVLGERSSAIEEYERVRALRRPQGSSRAAELAEAGLAAPFATRPFLDGRSPATGGSSLR